MRAEQAGNRVDTIWSKHFFDMKKIKHDVSKVAKQARATRSYRNAPAQTNTHNKATTYKTQAANQNPKHMFNNHFVNVGLRVECTSCRCNNLSIYGLNTARPHLKYFFIAKSTSDDNRTNIMRCTARTNVNQRDICMSKRPQLWRQQ